MAEAQALTLRDFTCETCGETRGLMEFYDSEHKVWIAHDLGIIVDHGEAELQKVKA